MSDVVVELFGRLAQGEARRGETSRGGRALRWVRFGRAAHQGPVIVLESGMGEAVPTWAPVVGGLAAEGAVVAYDRAGIGMSDPADGPVSGDSQVADLAAVIEDAGAPCVLVGHSIGGLLAQVLAWRRPELIAGLVLVDPTHEAMLRHMPPELREAMRAQQESFATMTAEEYVASNAAEVAEAAAGVTDDADIRALIVDAWRACYADDSRLRAVHAEATAAEESMARAAELREAHRFPTVPSVVLSATTGMPEDVRAVITDLHGQVATALGAEHVSVADAGHYIHWDRPGAVVGAVRRVRDAARANAR